MKHYPVAIVSDDHGNAIPLTQPNGERRFADSAGNLYDSTGAPAATHLTFPANAVEAARAPLCPTPFGKRGFWLEETENGWLVIVRERVLRTEDPPTYGFETISKHVCKSSVEVILLLAARMTGQLPSPPPSTPPPERTVKIRFGTDDAPRRAEPSWSKEVDDIFGSVLPKNHGDGPPCGSCGAITVRAGSCYACRECGSTTGCG